MFRDAPPSLTLPLKGGGDRAAPCFPSPLEGEGREGGEPLPRAARRPLS